MKKYFLVLLMMFVCVFDVKAELVKSDAIQVSDQEAVLLFRYVEGAGVPLLEDTKNQILRAEVMMCSIYFSTGIGPKKVRCLLPHEQVKIENDNAVEVADILKSYNMPSDHKFGYETIQAGLDCTKDLSGDHYPICFLSPRTLQ